ncbi:MAG: hypothetical protein AB7N24_11925 [Dehalococcoidia bacterium]
MIEGLNGIGKTLAVRLLLLCTGTAPYPANAPAWESLRRDLGAFTVTVTGLNGGRQVRWKSDSRDWPATAAGSISSDWFSEITIDGQLASLDQARQLLSVVRLGGEEVIVEILAQEAEMFVENVRRWQRRFTDPSVGPLATLEAQAADSLSLLGTLSTRDVEKLSMEIESAAADTELAEREADQARTLRDNLAHARTLRQHLDDLRRRTPELAEQLAAVDLEINQVKIQVESLEARWRGLVTQVATTEPWATQLKNARRTAQTRRDQLGTQLQNAALLALDLGIEADPTITRSLISSSTDEAAQLESERQALDAAPAMLSLLTDMDAKLASAERDGLGSEVALEDADNQLELTVAEVRAGVSLRQSTIRSTPPPVEAESISEKLNEVRERLKKAQSLRSTLNEAERLRGLVARNESRVKAALSRLNPNAIEEMQEVERLREIAQDSLLNLASKRSALAQQLGTEGNQTTEQSLQNQLTNVLAGIEVAADSIDARLTDVESDLSRRQMELTAARDHDADLRKELGRVRSDIRRGYLALLNREELTWIRSVVPAAAIRAEAGTPLQQLSALEAARAIAERVNDRLGKPRGQLAALEYGLQVVARHLRDRGSEPEAKYVPELQNWLGKRFSGWFNAPRVREVLLPEADGEIAVDAEAGEVTWTEHGAHRSRPLSAFSSGEQVFVYTRARLALLEEEETKQANRLIVLDEFGAFVAHDRLTALLDYLKERVREHPRDQMLVMLPLTRDYSQDASSAIGEDADRLRRLASDVAAKSYTIQVLHE